MRVFFLATLHTFAAYEIKTNTARARWALGTGGFAALALLPDIERGVGSVGEDPRTGSSLSCAPDQCYNSAESSVSFLLS